MKYLELKEKAEFEDAFSKALKLKPATGLGARAMSSSKKSAK
ncbi:hypothetical protein SJ05684_c18480 [Sinorhizobium sojae CCBAU 05684]|uniref:Uncharacterized protein n=1 Tax=Sinorhizobium sojae CCBAU 05684 TaxID=716928 RepID=A0A249PBG4_9HYPH|nr:hypothetical protein SJ05684_c18480 [Sinorhizobium sojae CCBAU 05684]